MPEKNTNKKRKTKKNNKKISKEKAAARPLQKTQMRSARQGIAVIAANVTNINARLTMPKCSSRSSS